MIENIDCTPDISYTLQWARRCPAKLPFSKGIQTPHGSLGPPESKYQMANLIGPANFVGLTGVINKQTMERQ